MFMCSGSSILHRRFGHKSGLQKYAKQASFGMNLTALKSYVLPRVFDCHLNNFRFLFVEDSALAVKNPWKRQNSPLLHALHHQLHHILPEHHLFIAQCTTPPQQSYRQELSQKVMDDFQVKMIFRIKFAFSFVNFSMCYMVFVSKHLRCGLLWFASLLLT